MRILLPRQSHELFNFFAQKNARAKGVKAFVQHKHVGRGHLLPRPFKHAQGCLAVGGAVFFTPQKAAAPGQNLANPLAAILSLEMALRWSLDRAEAADKLYAAVVKALEGGARTRDLGGSLSTVQMGDAVLAAL